MEMKLNGVMPFKDRKVYVTGTGEFCERAGVAFVDSEYDGKSYHYVDEYGDITDLMEDDPKIAIIGNFGDRVPISALANYFYYGDHEEYSSFNMRYFKEDLGKYIDVYVDNPGNDITIVLRLDIHRDGYMYIQIESSTYGIFDSRYPKMWSPDREGEWDVKDLWRRISHAVDCYYHVTRCKPTLKMEIGARDNYCSNMSAEEAEARFDKMDELVSVVEKLINETNNTFLK